jgi:hypothetical protein
MNECTKTWKIKYKQKTRHPATKPLTIIQKPGLKIKLNYAMTSLVSACFLSWSALGIRQFKMNLNYVGVKTKGIYDRVATVRIFKRSP